MDYREMFNHIDDNITTSKGEQVMTLSRLLPTVAVNRVVMATFTDIGFVDAFYTSYESSNLQNIPNFIVVAIDMDSYGILKSKGFPVAYFPSTRLSDEEIKSKSTFGTIVFRQKMTIKNLIRRQILVLGYDVLLYDSDVIFFKNPLPAILSYKDYDFISQKDRSVCAGFAFFRATLNSIRFINNVLKYMVVLNKSDQPTMVYLLEHNMQPSLRWILLPENIFSSGKVFFSQHQFYWDPINSEQIMLHNNWVMGYTNKLYRLREMHLYPLDVNMEYSNSNGRYLMLETVMQGKEKQALLFAINLANKLKRSFVVPRLPCDPSINLKECNLCGNQLVYCHEDIMKRAKLPWKEHVFFDNQHVPDTIRTAAASIAPIAFCSPSSLICQKKGLNKMQIVCIDVKKSPKVMSDIVTVLSKLESFSVIRIHSLDYVV